MILRRPLHIPLQLFELILESPFLVSERLSSLPAQSATARSRRRRAALLVLLLTLPTLRKRIEQLVLAALLLFEHLSRSTGQIVKRTGHAIAPTLLEFLQRLL